MTGLSDSLVTLGGFASWSVCASYAGTTFDALRNKPMMSGMVRHSLNVLLLFQGDEAASGVEVSHSKCCLSKEVAGLGIQE